MTTETTTPPAADYPTRRKTEQRIAAMTAEELQAAMKDIVRELWMYEVRQYHDREEAVRRQMYQSAHTHHERCRAAGDCARLVYKALKVI